MTANTFSTKPLYEAFIEIGFTPPIQINLLYQFELPYKGYQFDFNITAWGGLRICLQEKDSIGYKINWCIGQEFGLIVPLVNFVKDIIETEKVDFLPFCSQIKPLYCDNNFIEKLNTLGFNNELLNTLHRQYALIESARFDRH